MMEAMFGYQIAPETLAGAAKKSSSDKPVVVALLDAKKAQNISIQLKALGLTKQEIVDALLEGKPPESHSRSWFLACRSS